MQVQLLQSDVSLAAQGCLRAMPTYKLQPICHSADAFAWQRLLQITQQLPMPFSAAAAGTEFVIFADVGQHVGVMQCFSMEHRRLTDAAAHAAITLIPATSPACQAVSIRGEAQLHATSWALVVKQPCLHQHCMLLSDGVAPASKPLAFSAVLCTNTGMSVHSC